MENKNLEDLINLIKQRPALYIGQNSISVLRGFLDGWFFGKEELSDNSILQQFEKWVQKHYKMDDRRTWDRIILCFSQDEANALNNFFLLFEKFLIEFYKNEKRE